MAFLIPCILLAIVPTMITAQIGTQLFGFDNVNMCCEMLSRFSPKFHTIKECGKGSWYEVLRVDMSDANSKCPDGWVEKTVEGVRVCGRGEVSKGCKSAFLCNSIMDYTKVCGRAIGYQYGHTDAFAPRSKNINQAYVDGLSITYGSPRKHIWTYAAAVREGLSTYISSNCPCWSSNINLPSGTPPPSFVGNNWYCESGNPKMEHPHQLFSKDPLWDGKDCEGTCCSNGKSPPWFSVTLPHSTNEDIEARLCSDEDSKGEEVFIKIFELYIQ